MDSRKKIGASSIALTCIILAAVVLVNILAGILTQRFFLKADLNPVQLFDLSEKTELVLQDMEHNVTVAMLQNEIEARADSYMGPITELLDKYASVAGSKIKVEYWDPDLRPTLREDYNLAAVEDFDILVISDTRVKHLKADDYFTYDTDSYGQYRLTGYQIEQELTGAINFVLAENVPGVVFTEGHGEQISYLSVYQRMFSSTGFTVSTQSLTSSLPEGTQILVIAAPSTDFTDEEITALNTFYLTGGNVIYLTLDESNKNINAWLSERGIEPQDGLVLDSASYISSYKYPVPEINAHEAFSGAAAGSAAVVMQPRSLNIIFTERSTTKVETLIRTTASSYERVFTSSSTTVDKQPEDRSGPFVIGALSASSATGSKVFVLPFTLAFDMMLESQAYRNNELLAAVNRYVYPSATSLIIPPKSGQTTPMVLTGTPSLVIRILLLAVLPLGVFLTGLLRWIRRRNL